MKEERRKWEGGRDERDVDKKKEGLLGLVIEGFRTPGIGCSDDVSLGMIRRVKGDV